MGMFIIGILLVMGISFLFVSFIVNKSYGESKERCNVQIDAKVVDYKEETHSDMNGSGPSYTAYYPIYEYNYNGIPYRRCSGVGNKKDSFHVGEIKKIYVNPINPEEIYDGDEIVGIVKNVFGIIGVILTIAGIIMIAINIL